MRRVAIVKRGRAGELVLPLADLVDHLGLRVGDAVIIRAAIITSRSEKRPALIVEAGDTNEVTDPLASIEPV